MFEGVSDHQLHQFITSRTSLPLNPISFTPFHDPYTPPPPQVLQPAAILHNQYFSTVHDDSKNGDDHEKLVSTNQQTHDDDDNVQWTNDEVLALLRTRSGMENWFPDFTWEYVSRKLAEMGFRKTAEKCKQKFEEESRYFDNNINYTKNYRFFNDPDQDHQLYQGENGNQDQIIPQQKLEKPICELLEGEEKTGKNLELEKKQVDPESEDQNVVEISKMKKRKIKENNKKFEMFKGFCEEIVKKMMDRQEEMHKKLLEDMVKREEEKIAKEEAWKKEEMERMNKELEIMAHEQAIAGDRQAIVIQVLKKFTSSSNFDEYNLLKERNTPKDPLEILKNSSKHIKTPTPSSDQQNSNSFTSQNDPTMMSSQNPNSTYSLNIPKLRTSSSENIIAPQNPNFMITNQTSPLDPNSFSTQKDTQEPKSNGKDDLGKRWPRDEVLALINLRCSLHGNGDQDHKEGIKAPLWERISQGMLELGYKRSAKRCKEKWENINKYFRKTRDVNKKRSLDSRTCPYFHHLSTLYNKGITFGMENNSGLSENGTGLPENLVGDQQDLSPSGSTHVTTMQVGEGEKNVPNFDFEF